MTQVYKSWSHGMTNVSNLEVNMLKNSSTLAVSVPINLSIKFDFVSVNGPRETYFVDAPLINVQESLYKVECLKHLCFLVLYIFKVFIIYL